MLGRAGIGWIAVICLSKTLLADDGKALLQRNCGSCHAISDGSQSRKFGAPNLWSTLRSYPNERLLIELSEGMGSRHAGMPQIQFSSEEIAIIQRYLARLE
ncbi:MAG: cytochrome c [Hyphomicrobium sp.]